MRLVRTAAIGAIVLVSSCSSRVETPAPPTQAFAARLAAATPPIRREGGFQLRDALASLHADGALVFTNGLRIEPLDVSHVSGTVTDRAVEYARAVPHGDVVVFQDAAGVEELRVLDAPSSTLRWRVSGASLSVEGDTVDATNGTTRLAHMSAPFAVDANGARIYLHPKIEGDVVELPLPAMTYPVVVDPLWTAGPTATGRVKAFSVPLADGKVLVGGGQTDSTGSATYLTTAEIYDPVTSTFTATTSAPFGFSIFHAATRLTDGKALILGFSSALYDPTAKTWTTATAAGDGVTGYAALVPLPDGGALAMGGMMIGPSAIRYHLASNSWTLLTHDKTRPQPLLAPLPGGKVLVMGGGTSGAALSSAEIYDPTTDAFTATGSMAEQHTGGFAGALPSGKVFVAGSASTSTAEIYDPAAGTWSALPAMLKVQTSPAVQLSDGSFLFAGAGGGAPGDYAQMFDPGTLSWVEAGPLLAVRQLHWLAPLPSGKAIVGGGANPAGDTYTTTEIFAKVGLGAACKGDVICTSGHCADGVCCDSACTDTCKSCSSGTCTAVSGPPVHGTCSGYACSAGACLTSCTSTMQCDPTMFCGSGACVMRHPLGDACTADEQCAGGHCTEGVCCEVASCGTGSSCATAAKKGHCEKLLGTACGAATECESGFCIDGNCCSTMCAPYVHCPMGACATGCSTDGDCTNGNYCSGGKCAPKLGNGTACSMGNTCNSGNCIDGFCCSESRSCSPYICATMGCLTTCSNDKDCTKGFGCSAGSCVPNSTGASCSTDGLSSVSKDGAVENCSPYRCRSSGVCGETCTSSTECVDGATCDTDKKQCVQPTPSSDSGGCGFASTGNGDGFLLVFLVVGAGISRRRARQSPL